MASTINADTGVVSGITGIVQTADATGNLTLQANGVSVLTVDTSLKSTFSGNIVTGANSRIGVGTVAPDCELNILANPQTVSYTVAGNSTTVGTDLHISGADGVQTRIVQDSFGANVYVAFTGRTARGTATTPTQTQSGDTLAQFTGRGFSNGTLQFGNASTGRLDVVAAENFTDTSRATNVQIFTTSVSSITPAAVATFSGNAVTIVGNVFPSANATYDLGSTTLRWKTVYTTDLELNNGIGDYTVVEGADDLFLYNNRSGKVFKFALIEVDPATAPPKARR